MSASDHIESGSPGEDDVLAGEYVLGALDHDTRRAVERRLAQDPGFAALVADWQTQFSALDSAYEEVAPPRAVWQQIEGKLFGTQERAPGLWQSVALWRGLAAVASLLLAIMAGLWIGGPFQRGGTEPAELAAVLQADGSDVRVLALYDPLSGALRLSRLSGSPGAAQDFELWLIEGSQPPLSMGVMPNSERAVVPVAEVLRGKLSSGVTLAISLEPSGGSPTGAPTGPVVAAGAVSAI